MGWGITYFLTTCLGIVGIQLLPQKATYFLITLSLVFLTWLDPFASIALLGLTLITYGTTQSKQSAILGLFIHLAFFLSPLFTNGSTLGKLGFLYYGLQNVGILIERYRGRITRIQLLDLLFHNSFWAKAFAGPILLPKEITAPKVEISKENLIAGIQRILFGIAKKWILADRLGIIVNTVFEGNPSDLKGITVVIASILFTFQMYLDFSAYTDIALGTAKLFGIHLKENFALPFRSKSISEYWKRTHISLIDWLRQNVFYYLTFKWRNTKHWAAIIGIMATFILSGIWHGFYWGFVIWGLLNGMYLAIGRYIKSKSIPFISTLWVVLIVSFANFFFKAASWDSIHALGQLVLAWENFEWMSDVIAILGNGGFLEQQYNLLELFVLLTVFFIFERKLEAISKDTQLKPSFIILLILSILFFANFHDGAAFIYVQF